MGQILQFLCFVYFGPCQNADAFCKLGEEIMRHNFLQIAGCISSPCHKRRLFSNLGTCGFVLKAIFLTENTASAQLWTDDEACKYLGTTAIFCDFVCASVM